MKTIAIVAFCLALALPFTAGCSKSAPESPDGKLHVAVGVPPVAYLAERAGGERVAVTALVTPGQSPHSYEPTPEQIIAVSKAKVFLATGWPFEKQLLIKLKDVNPTMTVVNLTDGIALRHMTADEEAGEEHEHERAAAHRHETGDPDPHIWMSPKNAVIMADTIGRAFAVADPTRAADYGKSAEALKAELVKLDNELSQTLAPLKGKRFFVYHPAFGYFADAYGLIQTPVEVEGKEPGLEQLNRFIALARESGVKVIFVQPQFSPRSAQVVAEKVGGAVVPMDDLAYNYVDSLRAMSHKIATALNAPKEEGK